MGKINGCLKCLFVFFNVLYAILGCLLIYAVVRTSIYSSQVSMIGGPGMGWFWVLAIGVLGISCLGIYAGFAENGLALKIFAGFMVVGMIIMMIFGIVMVVARNKVKEELDSATSDMIKPYLEKQDMRAALEAIQTSVHCCGVVSTEDWDNNIPESCACKSPAYGYTCKSTPQGNKGPTSIYAQTCSEVIYPYVNILFKILMAIFFGFAVTALLGLLVSILMVHQVRRHDSARGASIAMKGY